MSSMLESNSTMPVGVPFRGASKKRNINLFWKFCRIVTISSFKLIHDALLFSSEVTISDSYRVLAHWLFCNPYIFGFSAKFMITFIFEKSTFNLLFTVDKMLADSPSGKTYQWLFLFSFLFFSSWPKYLLKLSKNLGLSERFRKYTRF